MKIEIRILEFSRLGTLNLTRMAHFKANTTVLLVSLLRVFEKFFTKKKIKTRHTYSLHSLSFENLIARNTF